MAAATRKRRKKRKKFNVSIKLRKGDRLVVSADSRAELRMTGTRNLKTELVERE